MKQLTVYEQYNIPEEIQRKIYQTFRALQLRQILHKKYEEIKIFLAKFCFDRRIKIHILFWDDFIEYFQTCYKNYTDDELIQTYFYLKAYAPDFLYYPNHITNVLFWKTMNIYNKIVQKIDSPLLHDEE